MIHISRRCPSALAGWLVAGSSRARQRGAPVCMRQRHRPPAAACVLARVADEAQALRLAPARPRQQARRSALFGWGVAAALGVFGLLTFLVRHVHSPAWDLALTLRFQRLRSRHLERLMRLASVPGFPPWSQLIVLGVAGMLWSARCRLEALFCFSTWVAGVVSSGVKLAVGRPRPDDPLVRVWFRLRDHSYPSGHTINYVTFYGYLFYLAYANLRPSFGRTLAMLVTGALVLLVGPSRVYNGQHWASDVLAAYSLGLGHLLGTVWLYRRARERAQRLRGAGVR
jgi:undecaprenyl-diphosphatase